MIEIAERGVRFRSYLDGSERLLGPEESMATQAALGSDIALVFDECTPYHADRDYTARSTERTHRWLDRCLDWHGDHGPGASRPCSGSSRAASIEDLRRESAEVVAAARGRRDRDRRHPRARQAGDVRGARPSRRRCFRSRRPSTCSGSASPTICSTGIELGIDLFDCAVPTRLARHGTALANLPESRFRFDARRAEFAADEGPLVDGCPCPTCRDHTRAYLHYLARAEPATAAKLLTAHNLAFLERLVAGARAAIAAGRFAAYKDGVLRGAAPRGRRSYCVCARMKSSIELIWSPRFSLMNSPMPVF